MPKSHTMDLESHQLHIYFLPMMAPGHMIPMIDIAREFARHGAKSTIITTPLNASQFSQTIERDQKQDLQINISLIKFPYQESGLPEGCENLSSTTTTEMSLKFINTLNLLQEPVENILQEGHPDCIVAGAFFWWATDLALKLKIPRLSFYATGFFPMCLYKSLKENKPHEKVGSDFEEFAVPGMPDVILISRKQLPDNIIEEDKHPLFKITKKILESELSSYGMIVNTFYELEPAYARHYREVHGIKAWHIGPVSLFNKSDKDKAHRGKQASSSDDHDCLSWLDSKKPNSVVYICFGSMAFFQTSQLHEIAKGLEASSHQFIWVVRQNAKDETNMGWLFEEFQRKMQGKGLIIKNWAPQVQILEHEAVGGFVTHCGWNSLLEGVAVGVPMVTWPLSAEQFFNEKMVTEILKTGIPVGAKEWSKRTDEGEAIKGEKIEKAVGELMGGKEGERMRRRAGELGDMAKRAVENGGSSESDLKCLLEEIKSFRHS